MPATLPLIGARRLITDEDICTVLRSAAVRSPTESHLLSLVMRSVIAMAKAIHVPRAVFVRQLEAAWDETNVPVILAETKH